MEATKQDLSAAVAAAMTSLPPRQSDPVACESVMTLLSATKSEYASGAGGDDDEAPAIKDDELPEWDHFDGNDDIDDFQNLESDGDDDVALLGDQDAITVRVVATDNDSDDDIGTNTLRIEALQQQLPGHYDSLRVTPAFLARRIQPLDEHASKIE